MAKKSESIQVFHVPPTKPVDFDAAFNAANVRATEAQQAFDRQRELLLAEYGAICWRRARGASVPDDAARVVAILEDKHVVDLKIDKTMFDRHVDICRKYDAKRALFLTVEQLQLERDRTHARVKELEESLRQAERDASAAGASLIYAHEADGDCRSIARQNPLLFDPPTGQPLDGTQLPIEMFASQK